MSNVSYDEKETFYIELRKNRGGGGRLAAPMVYVSYWKKPKFSVLSGTVIANWDIWAKAGFSKGDQIAVACANRRKIKLFKHPDGVKLANSGSRKDKANRGKVHFTIHNTERWPHVRKGDYFSVAVEFVNSNNEITFTIDN